MVLMWKSRKFLC